MLMVLRQCPGTNNISPVTCLTRIDVNHRDDTCCSGLDDNAGCLVELVIENILIVGKSNDKLDDKLATSCYNGTASAPVGMFPVDAVILFVKTDDVLCVLGTSIGVDENTVEILR
jgi:hypothetical protein